MVKSKLEHYVGYRSRVRLVNLKTELSPMWMTNLIGMFEWYVLIYLESKLNLGSLF